MIRMDSFDKSKFYIGKLCKRGHEYSGSGGSLRNINYCDCLECVKVRGGKRTAIWQAAREKYYLENKDKIESKKKQLIEKRKLQNREYSHRAYLKTKEKPNYLLKIRELNKKIVTNLTDGYVRKKIIRTTVFAKCSEVPDELIPLKREQILLTRLIRGIKNGLN